MVVHAAEVQRRLYSIIDKHQGLIKCVRCMPRDFKKLGPICSLPSTDLKFSKYTTLQLIVERMIGDTDYKDL